MAEPAVSITTPARASRSRRWHNSLPAWIVHEAGYGRLSQSIRQTLQAIADACDPPSSHGDGSLTVAFGGQPLYEAAGCCKRTFWDHLKRLAACGFVVQLGRGGTYGGRSYANQYGIPGSRGALSGRCCRPRLQRMVRHDDGKFRPEVLAPGDQATLWGRQADVDNLSDSCEQLASYSQPRAESARGGSADSALPPCKTCTPPYPHESPDEKNHEAGRESPSVWITPPGRRSSGSRDKNNNGARREKPQRRRRRGGTHVDADDLTSTPRLLNLFRAFCDKGIVQDGPHDRLQFFAMAEHVLSYRDDDGRPPNNPAAMFASNVRNGRWLYVTPRHEQTAQRRLRRFMDGA